MTDKELIKQEIERRIKNLEFSLENNCVEKHSKLDILGNITTLESLLQFIDSMEGSVNENEEINMKTGIELSEFDNDMMNAIICLTKQGRHLEEEHINWIKNFIMNEID